jgi:hypothetical protein
VLSILSGYSGVTVVLQWCYSSATLVLVVVTVVIQWCYSGVAEVVQWWYSGVIDLKRVLSSAFSSFFKRVASLSSDSKFLHRLSSPH